MQAEIILVRIFGSNLKRSWQAPDYGRNFFKAKYIAEKMDTGWL